MISKAAAAAIKRMKKICNNRIHKVFLVANKTKRKRMINKIAMRKSVSPMIHKAYLILTQVVKTLLI